MADTYEHPRDVVPTGTPAEHSLVTLTHVMYGLHSLSILIGVTSAVTIVGAFVFGFPSIIAVIINYVKRNEARGTYLDSHFAWQLRTFWFAVLWGSIGIVLWIVLAIVLIGFVIGPGIMVATGLWVIYRVIRGWLALRDGRAIGS